MNQPHESALPRGSTGQYRLGSICSTEELEELWTIDDAAYRAASISYEKFRSWWLAYRSGLLVLHWGRRIGGALGLWPFPAGQQPA